jgi:hypothetical protein
MHLMVEIGFAMLFMGEWQIMATSSKGTMARPSNSPASETKV